MLLQQKGLVDGIQSIHRSSDVCTVMDGYRSGRPIASDMDICNKYETVRTPCKMYEQPQYQSAKTVSIF